MALKVIHFPSFSKTHALSSKNFLENLLGPKPRDTSSTDKWSASTTDSGINNSPNFMKGRWSFTYQLEASRTLQLLEPTEIL